MYNLKVRFGDKVHDLNLVTHLLLVAYKKHRLYLFAIHAVNVHKS